VTRSFLFTVLVVCAAAGGCAQNAILELTEQVPADPAATSTSPRYALLQAHTGESFDAMWAGSGGIEGTALSATTPTTLHVSVVADDSAVQLAKLAIRVRFCGTPACTGPGDDNASEVRYVFDRAFYRGKVTRKTLPPITALPTGTPTPTSPVPTVIPKCEVEGCVEGATMNFCHADGVTHFCEG
jgi:hypothetical protein